MVASDQLPEERERARQLVLAHGWNATAYQILHPGIELWFALEGDAVIGFVQHGRTRVVAGAPVCAANRVGAVAASFEANAAARRERVCYFAAESRLREVDRPRPWAMLSLGAQPVWRPAELAATFAAHRSLRAQLHRARNKGIHVAEWPAERVAGDNRLRVCLAEWLATRGLPPLHFLVEPNVLDAPLDRRVFVAVREDEPVAFLVATPIPARAGWLVEQIVRGRRACNGTGELLLATAAAALAAAGAAHVTLGLTPLAARTGPLAAPPLRVRFVLAWLRGHGRRFYDFRGLEAWKAKFRPEQWEPVFALVPGRRIGLCTLWAIAGAFARGSPLWLAVRGLTRAAVAELRRARRWLGRCWLGRR